MKRPAARWTVAAAAVLVLGAVLLMAPRPREERPVRLGPGVVLSPDALPERVELDLGNGVAMRFALIRPGHFLMGSPPDERGRDTDETQHEVMIARPFYLAVTTVTQEQYEQVAGSSPSHFKGPKNPVETVSWDDATAFCGLVLQRTGRRVRLPTEAEWEYACRAGASGPFNAGLTLPRDAANYGIAWTYPSNRAGRRRGEPMPVASFRPNAWGLCDMHGNVFQWCADWHANYPTARATDPTGPANGTSRVVRGGSWLDVPQFCRAAYRDNYAPDYRDGSFGFRLALDFH